MKLSLLACISNLVLTFNTFMVSKKIRLIVEYALDPAKR